MVSTKGLIFNGTRVTIVAIFLLSFLPLFYNSGILREQPRHAKLSKPMGRRSVWYTSNDDLASIGSWNVPDKIFGVMNPDWQVLSVGAANDVSFDLGIADVAGVTVYVVDPTPMAVDHFHFVSRVLKNKTVEFNETHEVSGEQKNGYFEKIHGTFIRDEQLVFIERALSTTDSASVRFYKLHRGAFANETYYSLDPNVYSEETIDVPTVTLQQLAKDRSHNGQFEIIKIDIEGFEVEVLNAMITDAILRPILLLVDHDAARLGKLQETISLMKRIENYGYIICRNVNWDAMYVRHDFANILRCSETCVLGCGKNSSDIDRSIQ